MAGDIGDDHGEPIVIEREKVEEVTSRLLGRSVPARHVETGNQRLLVGEQALLDGPRDVEVALQFLFLGEVLE